LIYSEKIKVKVNLNLNFEMPNKHCCYSDCNSDSRRPQHEINFVQFVSNVKDPRRAKRWVHLCGRKDFTVANITRFTYICTKHFRADTTDFNPRSNPQLEPLPANSSQDVVFRPQSKWQDGDENTENKINNAMDDARDNAVDDTMDNAMDDDMDNVMDNAMDNDMDDATHGKKFTNI
jgi:hypothetical protein